MAERKEQIKKQNQIGIILKWIYTRWYFWLIIVCWIFLTNGLFRDSISSTIGSILSKIFILTIIFTLIWYLKDRKKQKNGKDK